MSHVEALLDSTADRIAGDEDALSVVEGLCLSLNDIRNSVSPEVWDSHIKPSCLKHPLRQIAHQDPYTWRAYAKSRGYAGDAVMLDYVYTGQPPDGTTPLGTPATLFPQVHKSASQCR